MAHVIGVPKRDPCRKCQLPVFLAERSMVGKKVYHRKCLKCARCGYQLTPGSFYETEIDEQYCCETCPDEEVTRKSMDQLPLDSRIVTVDCPNASTRNISECDTNVLKSPVKSVRNSIRERLEFFENRQCNEESETKLLQQSLSDEEKSKSLQRIENAPQSVEASYKPNEALSNFLTNIVADEEDLSETSFSTQNSKKDEYDSEDDTNVRGVSLSPALPKSLPPSNDLSLNKSWFSVSAQLILDSSLSASTTEETDEQQNVLRPENTGSDMRNNLLSFNKDDSNNNDEVPVDSLGNLADCDQNEKKTVELHKEKLTESLECSEINDNYCIAKEKAIGEINAMMTSPTEHLQEMHERTDLTQANVRLSLNHDENPTMKYNNSIQDCGRELRRKDHEECSNACQQFEDNAAKRVNVIGNLRQQFELEISNLKAESSSSKSATTNGVACEKFFNDDNITQLKATDPAEKTIDEGTTTNAVTEMEKQANSIKSTISVEKVPQITTPKEIEQSEGNNSLQCIDDVEVSPKSSCKTHIEEYPDDLNPFKSDEEGEADPESNGENKEIKSLHSSVLKENLNPFDSSDDEVELEKLQKSNKSTTKVPPPRPPPPRISKNPFGSEDEDDPSNQIFARHSTLRGSQSRKTPVPTPRSNKSHSQNSTPEPTPRLSTKANTPISNSPSATPNNSCFAVLQNSSEIYGSVNSLYSNNPTPPHLILRNSDIRSSNNSLNVSAGGTIRSRKARRAPLPPAPVKELFPSNETINSSSKTSTPSSSTVGTPKSSRKKRPAPAPPKPARLESAPVQQLTVENATTQPKNLNSYPLQSELDSKLSDEEKALLEGKILQPFNNEESDLSRSPSSRRTSKRLIPLDQELLEEHGAVHYVEEESSHCDDLKEQNQRKPLSVYEEETSVVYRRVLIPQNLETPKHDINMIVADLSRIPIGERQLVKLKDNKEANNRNRQSQISVTSSGADDNDPLFNKSAHGKWKRRKGPAPALPIPPRKVLQMLPLQEIKHELEIIEVQQQGLEKQGVILEKMIRDRCEDENGEPLDASGLPIESGDSATNPLAAQNSKEVENLILQLFELVNEKNELFRRQAELMYLRRQHRLEQEQADLEYEIRILMAQPERNKTDSDKAREEALIERLVEVVQLRNEVVDCLEMDRLREAEEDQSIKQRLESHIAKRENDPNMKKTLAKLSKKEKKKQKETKKLFRSKKLDADKDADESELDADKLKSKKKKKLLIF